MKLSNLQKKLEKSEQYLPAEDTFFLADHLTWSKWKIRIRYWVWFRISDQIF